MLKSYTKYNIQVYRNYDNLNKFLLNFKLFNLLEILIVKKLQNTF